MTTQVTLSELATITTVIHRQLISTINGATNQITNGVPLHDVYEAMNPIEKGRARGVGDRRQPDARAEGHPDHAKELQAIQAHQEGGDYKT